MDQVIQKRNFFKLCDSPYDVAKLTAEMEAAENKHKYLSKNISGWSSIPLRSVGGMEGERGNLGSGINNSANPSDYKDTTVMTECPYLKSILDSFGAPILKVRIMKLTKNKIIAPHVDQFSDSNIIRFHIPVVTDQNVRFFVEKENRHLEAGFLYWVNVRKSHHVTNTSKLIDRIHIVFDMFRNDAIDSLFIKNANNYLK